MIQITRITELIMIITTEQIHATADQLQAQGIKPSQRNVRNVLGGGSFTTISEALRTWRAEQETVAELAQVVLPQEIAERADTLVAQLWDTAQSIANDRLVKEREALEHTKALAQLEVDEMTAVVAILEQEQNATAKQVERLEAELREIKAQRDGLQSELAEMRTERTHLSDKLKDQQNHSQELQKRLDELMDENKSMTQELAKLSAFNQLKTAEIEKTALLHQEQTQNATAQLEKVKADLLLSIQENAKLQGRLEQSADAQAKADNTLKEQSDKIAELSALVAQLKAKKPTRTVSKPKTAQKVQ